MKKEIKHNKNRKKVIGIGAISLVAASPIIVAAASGYEINKASKMANVVPHDEAMSPVIPEDEAMAPVIPEDEAMSKLTPPDLTISETDDYLAIVDEMDPSVFGWEGQSSTPNNTLTKDNLTDFSTYSSETDTLSINEGVSQIEDDAITSLLNNEKHPIDSLVLPDSLTSITNKPFTSFKIKELTLGAKVVSIEDNSFEAAEFTSINFDMSIDQFKTLKLNAKTFNTPEIKVVQSGKIQNYIATNFKEGYQDAFVEFDNDGGWIASGTPNNSYIEGGDVKKFTSFDKKNGTLYFKEGVVAINMMAMAWSSEFGDTSDWIKSVFLPSSLENIYTDAFSSTASALTSLYIPPDSKLSSIGRTAFSYARITELTLPSSIQWINMGAFGGSPIESLTINKPFGSSPKLSLANASFAGTDPKNVHGEGWTVENIKSEYADAFKK